MSSEARVGVRRRASVIAILAVGALALSAVPAAAESWTTAKVLASSSNPDLHYSVDDIDVRNGFVVVAITEGIFDEGTQTYLPSTRVGISSTNGGSFSLTPAHDLRQPAVAGCGPGGVILTGTRVIAGDRAPVLLTDGAPSIYFENPGLQASRPDLACVGTARVAVAYLLSGGGTTTLELQSIGSDLANDLNVAFPLGKTDKGSDPAVAAVGDRIYVAWVTGTRLKLKRFTVGGGPGYQLTAQRTITLDQGSGLRSPVLAADGKRVVVAWQRGQDLVARVSTDKAVSFGARKVLIDGVKTPIGVRGTATGASIKGGTIVVSGSTFGDDSGLIRSAVYRSTNNGGSWTRMAGSVKTNGEVVAAVGAGSTVHIAFDRSWTPDSDTVSYQQTVS